MKEAVTHSSGLSDDEVNALRGLVLRRRNSEAERWLVSRGFTADRAARIILEQELAVSNAIYAAPLWDIALAILPALIALFLIGMAADAQYADGLKAFAYRGSQRTLILGTIVTPLFLASAFFALRAVKGTWLYLKARVQYRSGHMQDGSG